MAVSQTGVLTDIVGSRALADRAAAQSAIRDAFERAHALVAPTEPLWATAGDEFQSVYARVGDAVTVTMLVRMFLAEGVDCRFGIGEGDITVVETAAEGIRPIQDGSAWWNARSAIDTVHRRQSHGQPWLRTWFAGADAADLVNAGLVVRDHVVSRMKARERRIAAAWFAGADQATIAREEKISQSAVSQTLGRSGATALWQTATLLNAADAGPTSPASGRMPA